MSVERVLLAWELPPYGRTRDGLRHDRESAFRKREEFGVEMEEMKGEEF